MKFLLIILISAANLFATNYYVKNSGDDAADGLSDATAWKTIAKVNAVLFQPGDNIYFKRGDVWREQLYMPSSGSQGNPITIGAYGSGYKPIFNAADIVISWTEYSANVWVANHPTSTATNATVVAVDNIKYTLVGSLNEINTVNTYYVDGTVSPAEIYIYSTVDPNSSNVEASARSYGIYVNVKQYVTIKNIDCRYASYAGIRLNGPQSNGYCIIDNCNLYANRQVGIIMYNGHNNNTVSYCVSTYNGNGYYSNIADNNTFSNNISEHNIRYVNGVVTDGHGFGLYRAKDCIIEYCESNDDSYGINSDPNGEAAGAIIRYNYIHNTKDGIEGIGLGNIGAGASYQIYYNLFVDNGGVGGGWSIGIPPTNGGDVYIYNNTMYEEGHGVAFQNGDNCYFKNNILYSRVSSGNALWIWAGSLTSDYNQFYFPNGTNIIKNGEDEYTSVANWTSATSQDTNSGEGDPLFTNPNQNNFILQNGSPCISSGVYVNLLKDFNGSPIPTYKPDKGAYQHPFLPVNIKVYLGGAYNEGMMTTYLRAQNLIPRSQPYNIAPWNYSGSDSVSDIPTSIVDWILIELRTGINGSTTIAQRVAFLKNDGSVVDLDGNSLLRFDFIPNGIYYIVVRQRNHLAIMSSHQVSLTDSSVLYNFSTSQSQTYGINSLIYLGNGLYGMYGGDGDANGGVSSNDRNNIWRVENGNIGYLQGDYDLNGVVNIDDLNLFWRISNGNLSQVPE